MGKRPLEETSRNGVEDMTMGESRASKKSRKEGKEKSEKKEKEMEKHRASVSTPTQDGKDEVEISKEDRTERKRLRRENRVAQKAASADKDTATEQSNSHVSEAEALNADKVAAKAARKAEKARLKGTKHAKKEVNGDVRSASFKPAETNGSSKEAAIGSSSSTSSSTYVQSASLTALPESEITTFLSTNHIAITDPLSSTATLRPITSFSHLPLNRSITGDPFAAYKTPTPIQSAAWPFLFSGRDVIGVAETGSGKTLAFALPCITHIVRLLSQPKPPQGPLAVIVSPTRELACQIEAQMSSLASLASLHSVCIYGGVPKPAQREALQTARIVVATPGRLNDLLSEGATSLSSASYVVLDEADRMLDTGFEDAIRLILTSCAPASTRQTLMFTATWPPSIRALAATFLRSPVKISIGADNPTGDLRANTRITQTIEVIDPRQKETRLLQLLRQHQPRTSSRQATDRILVFCLYKKEATRIEQHLRYNGIPVAAIHGDLAQSQRTASLEAFKSGSVPVLVATDVAARGLDIPEVKAVINLTFPLTVEDYVHRIGRTGRAGKPGLAITLFTEHDKALSGGLINVLKAAKQPVPEALLKFGTTVKRKGHDAYGAFYKDVSAGEVKTAKKIKFDD